LIRQPGPYFYAGDGLQLVGLDGITNSQVAVVGAAATCVTGVAELVAPPAVNASGSCSTASWEPQDAGSSVFLTSSKIEQFS
jgi:hypothetical protein